MEPIIMPIGKQTRKLQSKIQVNTIQIPLNDNDRNGLYDMFDGISDQIGDLIELTAKIKQIDQVLYQ